MTKEEFIDKWTLVLLKSEINEFQSDLDTLLSESNSCKYNPEMSDEELDVLLDAFYHETSTFLPSKQMRIFLNYILNVPKPDKQ